MGTRHYQTVITKEGETKVRQYGQWDGYPSGQGIEILKYIRNGDLNKYQEELSKLNEINDEQKDIVDKDDNWKVNYPYLSRDCGSNIHKMIEEGQVKFVAHTDEEEANKWCEGFYTIDFSKRIFTSEYHGVMTEFSLDNLPTDEMYLSAMKGVYEEE